MNIEFISKSTVKATLTPADLSRFKLDYDSISETNTQTKKLIVYILNELLRLKGKDLSNEHLYIEVFPTVNGGCLLYLSVSSDLTEENDNDDDLPAEFIFSFSNTDELIGCAAELKRLFGKYIKNSSLYYSDEDFRLIIEVSEGSSVNELSDKYREEQHELNIKAAHTREHCTKLISSCAVERLAQLSLS